MKEEASNIEEAALVLTQEQQALAEASPETKQQSNEVLDSFMELRKLSAHLSAANRLIGMVSNNGLRRTIRMYLKAGLEEINDNTLQNNNEKALLKHLVQAQDLKYSLIMKAIDEQVATEVAAQGTQETSNETQTTTQGDNDNG
jgi:hypothetical protein